MEVSAGNLTGARTARAMLSPRWYALSNGDSWKHIAYSVHPSD